MKGYSVSKRRSETELRCDISIVIPIYNELENLEPLLQDITATLQSRHLSFEVIFVDDGSSPPTKEKLRELAENNTTVSVVELARNFGQQLAITAGLSYVTGRTVMIMDGDRQDPPELIPDLYARWKEGFDIVYAIRTKRKEGFVKRSVYALYYKALRFLAQIDIPLDSGDFCLMDRQVVELMNEMPERNRFIRGLRSWVGLKQIGVEYERRARAAGDPKYTLGKLMKLGLDGIFSFSFVPLRIISVLGVIISAFSIILAIFYAIKKLLVGLHPEGFATIVVMISFFSGIQLITLGIIGEYIGRIFEEAKQRPLFVVRNVIRRSTSPVD